MVKRTIIAPPDGERIVNLLKEIRESSSKGDTRSPGQKILGENDDIFWAGFDAEGLPKDFSIRDISGDLIAAEDRIADAEASLAESQDRLDAAETTVAETKDRLTTVETVTIPDAVAQLEAADAAASQELGELDGKIATAQQDLAAAGNDIDQLRTDLDAEASAREQLSASVAADLGDLDTALQTAFPQGAFDVSAELAQTIRDQIVEYAVSSSETTPPTTGWSALTPTRTPGTFIWFRTRITYADNSVSYSSAALLTGNAGADGEPGPKGEDGTSVTILGTKASEAELPSSGNTPGDGWLIDGYLHVWTGSSWENVGLIQGPAGATGAKGDKGDPGSPGAPGIGIASVTPYFRRQSTGTAAPAKPTTMTPSGWTATEPDWTSSTELYRTERVVYSNATFAYTDVTKVAVFAGIDLAMAAANGKNLNTYSDLPIASKPGPAPAPDSSRTVGDIHRNRYTSTGEIWAEYQWTGTTWRQVTFGNEILSSLDVGKLTAGSAAVGSAVVEKLWVDGIVGKTATFSQIAIASGNTVTDPNGLNPTLRAQMGGPSWSWDDAGKYWKRPAVQGGTTQFNAYTATTTNYDASLLTPGAMYVISYEVWVDKVGPSTGGRASIYYRRVDGTVAFVGDGTEAGGDSNATDPITPGTWTKVERFWRAPDDVSSGGVNFQIIFGASDATEVRIRKPYVGKQASSVLIEDGAVNAQKINAQSVGGAVGSFVEANVGKLVADSTTTKTAVIDKLWSDGISAKSITASRLLVGSGNLVPNGLGEMGSGHGWPTYTFVSGAPAETGAVNGFQSSSSSFHSINEDAPFFVKPGRQYTMDVWLNTSAAGMDTAIQILFLNSAGAQVGSSYPIWPKAMPQGLGYFEGSFTAPAGSVSAWLRAVPRHSNGATGTTTFYALRVRPKAGSVLIEDGAVTTPKLTVTEDMSAAIVDAMSVNAKKLVVSDEAILNKATLIGQTVVDDINVNGKLVGTDGVFTGTVDFENVNVTGTQIVNELGANSISADKISGGSFVGKEFVGGDFIGSQFQTSITEGGANLAISNNAWFGFPGVAFGRGNSNFSTPAALAAYANDGRGYEPGALVMHGARVGQPEARVAATPTIANIYYRTSEGGAQSEALARSDQARLYHQPSSGGISDFLADANGARMSSSSSTGETRSTIGLQPSGAPWYSRTNAGEVTFASLEPTVYVVTETASWSSSYNTGGFVVKESLAGRHCHARVRYTRKSTSLSLGGSFVDMGSGWIPSALRRSLNDYIDIRPVASGNTMGVLYVNYETGQLMIRTNGESLTIQPGNFFCVTFDWFIPN